MYDPKQEAREFIAEDRDAAIVKARSFFGAEGDELVIQEFASGEVYGLGGRALVVAMLRDRKPVVRGDRERERERDRGGRGRGRGNREGRERRGGEARSAAPPAEPSVGTVEGALGEIAQFVRGAVERLEVGSFTIGESQESGVTIVNLKGKAAEVLAEGEARALDALQLLANQVAARLELTGRVVLDVEGGSESRERHLGRLAERVVRRAKESGRAVALDPMNGRDRRIIHLAVREQEGVATMSMGEGRYRQVVIVPEGAPEYDEAVRVSEAADQQPGG